MSCTQTQPQPPSVDHHPTAFSSCQHFFSFDIFDQTQIPCFNPEEHVWINLIRKNFTTKDMKKLQETFDFDVNYLCEDIFKILINHPNGYYDTHLFQELHEKTFDLVITSFCNFSFIKNTHTSSFCIEKWFENKFDVHPTEMIRFFSMIAFYASHPKILDWIDDNMLEDVQTLQEHSSIRPLLAQYNICLNQLITNANNCYVNIDDVHTSTFSSNQQIGIKNPNQSVKDWHKNNVVEKMNLISVLLMLHNERNMVFENDNQPYKLFQSTIYTLKHMIYHVKDLVIQQMICHAHLKSFLTDCAYKKLFYQHLTVIYRYFTTMVDTHPFFNNCIITYTRFDFDQRCVKNPTHVQSNWDRTLKYQDNTYCILVLIGFMCVDHMHNFIHLNCQQQDTIQLITSMNQCLSNVFDRLRVNNGLYSPVQNQRLKNNTESHLDQHSCSLKQALEKKMYVLCALC